MHRRHLGNTNVEVSTIALGCWVFDGDWSGQRSQQDCDRMCSFALDCGITYFDNGDAYGNGRAEELFGGWLRSAAIDRSRIQIGGKFGYDFYSDPGEAGSHRERRQDFSASFMRSALERSLARLGTDYLDLYLAQDIKLRHFNDELFAALEDVRRQGKIRAWGVSLGPAIGWREEGFRAMGDYGAKVVQTVYNVLEQHPGYEFCEMATATRAGVLARVQDNSGVLKDAAGPDAHIPENDRRRFRDANWKKYGPLKVEKLRPIAAAHGMSIHQLACKWLLQANPSLAAITATLLNEAEIKEVCGIFEKSDLSFDELRQIARLYREDFGLPPGAHPCDLESSVSSSGFVRSQYVPPPTVLA